MPAATLSFDGPDVLRDPVLRSRAASFALAGLLHAGVLALLLSLPPAVYEPVRRAVSAVEVRLYTVSGGADAESDAPLFEPPMAAEPDEAAGRGGADAAATIEETPQDTVEETPSEPVDATPEPAPQERPADPPEAAAPAELAADTPGPADTGETRLGGAPAGSAEAAPQSQAQPSQPGAPVATTQATPPERGEIAAARPPTFAEILARAETRLDPADFQVAELLGGVRGATRESFCLSSASGNREAMDCPDAPNAASADLARYGLTGLGEEMPEFDIEMSRLEYKLRTLGADDNAIMRIMTALGEARHEAVYGNQVRRSLNRDRRDRDVDHLGNPRFGVPMPDNPGG